MSDFELDRHLWETQSDRLRRLNAEKADKLHKSQEDFQKSSKPLQSPGVCRVCGREVCNNSHLG